MTTIPSHPTTDLAPSNEQRAPLRLPVLLDPMEPSAIRAPTNRGNDTPTWADTLSWGDDTQVDGETQQVEDSQIDPETEDEPPNPPLPVQGNIDERVHMTNKRTRVFYELDAFKKRFQSVDPVAEGLLNLQSPSQG